MTSRQARRERREAERKAAKLAYKADKVATATIGVVSQNGEFDPPQPSRDRQKVDLGFVSQKRVAANRANAQLSTGPRTPQGRLASSRNSLKHGLASGAMIIPGEDPAAFEALRSDLLEEHQPANATEELLVIEMAQSFWLAQRAIRLQNDCFTKDGVDDKRLSVYLRYQITHDRAFHKALTTLSRLQKDRRKLERGFVSQQPAPFPHEDQFVRQNDPDTASNAGFVSQKSAPEPAPLSSIAAEAA